MRLISWCACYWCRTGALSGFCAADTEDDTEGLNTSYGAGRAGSVSKPPDVRWTTAPGRGARPRLSLK